MISYYRHSNFGGSYVVTEQLTISGKGRVHHKPLAGAVVVVHQQKTICIIANLSCQQLLSRCREASTTHSKEQENSSRPSKGTTINIQHQVMCLPFTYHADSDTINRLVLKEFCIQLLECCFNVLMRVVKVTPCNISLVFAMTHNYC